MWLRLQQVKTPSPGGRNSTEKLVVRFERYGVESGPSQMITEGWSTASWAAAASMRHQPRVLQLDKSQILLSLWCLIGGTSTKRNAERSTYPGIECTAASNSSIFSGEVLCWGTEQKSIHAYLGPYQGSLKQIYSSILYIAKEKLERKGKRS